MTMANGAAAAAEPVRPGSDSGSGSASVGSGVGGTPVKSASAAPHKPVLLRAHDKPFAFEKKLVDFIYDRTCTCMCACLCTMFLLTLIVIGGGLMVLSEPTEYDWTISDSDVSRNLDAMQDATSRVDAVSGGSSSSSSTAERTEVRWIEALSIMYTRADERRDVSVFTPEGVQDMCELENLMLAHPDYRNYCVLDAGGKCDKQPKSVSSYFYSSGQTLESWGYGAYDCVLLDQVRAGRGRACGRGAACPCHGGVPRPPPRTAGWCWWGHPGRALPPYSRASRASRALSALVPACATGHCGCGSQPAADAHHVRHSAAEDHRRLLPVQHRADGWLLLRDPVAAGPGCAAAWLRQRGRP